MKRWPVYVVLGQLVFFGVLFVGLFFLLTAEEINGDAATPEMLDSATVVALLPQGDPARGRSLAVQFGCTTCHESPSGAMIAPAYAGIAERAGRRVEGLTAAEYIFESIVAPRSYLVEGYAASMPENFRARLTDAELADIVSYLLKYDEP